MKIFKIILVNIILMAVLLFIVEASIWYCENKRLVLTKDEYVMKHGFFPFHKGISGFQLDLKYFPDESHNWGRNPEGLEYKDKKPIVLFGCSYAYGFMLEKHQTLSYKLAQYAKRPVYNRAFSSWGAAHMLYQARNELLYEQIPEPEYVMFMSMHDHFRRLYIMTFMSGDMLMENFYLRYKEKNGKLIEITHKNKLLNFIKRLYITQKIHHFYVNNILLKKDDYTKGYDLYFKQISESKKEMEKHWPNTKYVFILYDWIKDEDLLLDKLKTEGFIIINLPKLTDEDIYSEKYVLEKDWHPNEDVWNLFTPIIAKELNL